MHPPYRLDRPRRILTPVVVASPHSGRHYPPEFLRASVLDERGDPVVGGCLHGHPGRRPRRGWARR